MYASVIVDLSLQDLDRIFDYSVPPELEDVVAPGVRVCVGFGKGNREIPGYVVDIRETVQIETDRIKPILSLDEAAVRVDGELLALASFLRRHYGGTTIAALKTVMPVDKRVRRKKKRIVRVKAEPGRLDTLIEVSHNRGHNVKERVLLALREQGEISERILITKLNATRALFSSLEKQGIIEIETVDELRDPMTRMVERVDKKAPVLLNDEQLSVVEEIENARDRNHLIMGVTGSGKTEVYMELAARAAARGCATIILIPEIALTFQTLVRFYGRFGERVAVIHSRLSDGERYDQFERARNGEIDVMIGPRSALFTPFERLGYIVIDEEQESSYKSEIVPRYHAREVAFERGRLSGAAVVLGSATPSVDAYYMAENGELTLHRLTKRAVAASLADVYVTDLRTELKNGNKTMISADLKSAIDKRLNRHEQIMLFLNRRGMSGVVACRSCGTVVKCPHCDVSLSLHADGKMKCHYCGYERDNVRVCETCGSEFIGTFKAGTERVEQQVRRLFPAARILRMDSDTVKKKDSYENILSAFANHEADILIGTQMIVKGHDFPEVTLVGILAADMSLGVPEYTAAERTFSLLTQAAGRAGRGEKQGEVFIQTYQPDNYAVRSAVAQDYEGFYEREIEYRRLLSYPPVSSLLICLVASRLEDEVRNFSAKLVEDIVSGFDDVRVIGPSKAGIYKVNDIYRMQVFVKSEDKRKLERVKDRAEVLLNIEGTRKKCYIVFDLS